MFGFPCKNCGHREIAHGLSIEKLEEISRLRSTCINGFLEHLFYGERTWEQFKKVVEEGYPGEATTLMNCPGFEYLQEDEEEAFGEYYREGQGIVPEKLKERYREYAQKMRDKKEMKHKAGFTHFIKLKTV